VTHSRNTTTYLKNKFYPNILSDYNNPDVLMLTNKVKNTTHSYFTYLHSTNFHINHVIGTGNATAHTIIYHSLLFHQCYFHDFLINF